MFIIINWVYFEYIKFEKDEDDENESGENKSQNESHSHSATNNPNLNENKANNDDDSFSIFDTFKKLIFSDIQVLIWNLLIGIIAIFSIDYHFLYSVQLFTMFFLIDTMYTDLIDLLPASLSGYSECKNCKINCPVAFYNSNIDVGFAICPIYNRTRDDFENCLHDIEKVSYADVK